MSAVPTCYYGSAEPLPPRRPLRAGPLTLEYEAGDLRYVRLGGREVIRRWYSAVRDQNWDTVPARLVGEEIEAGPDHFRVEYRAEHRQGDIDFAWNGSIAGAPDGTIIFRMDGVARSTFLRNRIGFCLLHPIRECADARCRFELGDGTSGEGLFPRFIAPHNPFHELRTFAHEVAPGVWAELRFEGDLFETEDQRNWTDASFKTFCTPLRMPFPATVEAGTRVTQTVSLRLLGLGPPLPAEAASDPSLTVCPEVAGGLPAIGLGTTADGPPLTRAELDRLRLLRPAHLRVDLELWAANYAHRLRREATHAAEVGVPLEVAVTVSDAAAEELAGFVRALREIQPPVCRWLIFHKKEWSTTEPWIRLARAALAEYAPAVSMFSGTPLNFTELNRARPPVPLLDGVCYSAQPQEHASDNASIVEACAALRDTVESARQFCGTLPLAVTPITLRKRTNPYATGPALPVPPGQLPPQVDPRQMSLFGAGWTLGTLKYLAESGVASVTYFQTTGWRGVMETEQGCPLPDKFPSQPGMVFPLYHVLADANEYAGAAVHLSDSAKPLVCDGLTLSAGGRLGILLANLTDSPQNVTVGGMQDHVRIRILDERTFEQATMAPLEFRAHAATEQRTKAGWILLNLRPYAYVRIDS
jgi:D-apionolactonase